MAVYQEPTLVARENERIAAPPIRAVCRVPLSFFDRMMGLYNYTELRCFALVLDCTVGHSDNWAAIPDEDFISACGVSKDWIRQALASLSAHNLIQRRPYSDGTRKRAEEWKRYLNECRTGEPIKGSNFDQTVSRTEYAVVDAIQRESKAARINGKCPSCQTVSVFRTGFIPVPHPALRKFGACGQRATYAAVMQIVRNSLRWNRKRGIWAEPTELCLEELTRVTKLGRRQIATGLKEAAKLGLIKQELRTGKPSIYTSVPERFGSLERRGMRVIHQPTNPNKIPRQKAQVDDKPEPEEQPGDSVKAQSYGLCQHCQCFTDLEPMDSESETPTIERERDLQAPVSIALMDTLRSLRYEDFLKTPYWRLVKRIIFARDQRLCSQCGNPGLLDVHHKTYEHHGDEANHL